MFIPTEGERISLPAESENKTSKTSSPEGSNPDSLDGLPRPSELSDSPPLSGNYTDVSIVPEQAKNELQQSIENLEDEIVQLRLKLRLLDKKRREALNKILDIKGSIRVFCRVRPFLFTDGRRSREPIIFESEKIAVKSSGSKKEFELDKVFSPEASQEDIFLEVGPIVKSAFDGHNVCVIAFGQTGTGKTFTMDGKTENPGIVPRALEELFRQVSLSSSSTIIFSMSMLEVYMGNLRDLLAPKPTSRTYGPLTRCNLNIQTDQRGLVDIEGLMEVPIPDFAKARWWYNKGRRARSTSWTNVNETSSRSHCLTRVTIYHHGDGSGAKAEVSKIWMVDLGGSERLLKTGASGLTLDEGRAINLSLSALGDVIAALRRKRGHVPYRNSKLTQILRDSLGDGSKVLMIVHISPCEEDVAETICSLSFAKRARAVESSRELPEDLKKQRKKKIAELEEDMKEAEEECQKVRNGIEKVELLLSENKRLLSKTSQNVENQVVDHSSPREDLKEALSTPRKPEKPIRRNVSDSMPRFMTATVASRQRQTAAERELADRTRSMRLGTRSSIQLITSQSFIHSDPRIKAILQHSNRKPRHAENNVHQTESPKCNASDSKTTFLPQSKNVTSSDPNFRVKRCHHRRRMSDLT